MYVFCEGVVVITFEWNVTVQKLPSERELEVSGLVLEEFPPINYLSCVKVRHDPKIGVLINCVFMLWHSFLCFLLSPFMQSEPIIWGSWILNLMISYVLN